MDAGTRRDFSSVAMTGAVALLFMHVSSYLLLGPDNYLPKRYRIVTPEPIRDVQEFIVPVGLFWLMCSVLLLIRLVNSYSKAKLLMKDAEQWGPWAWVSNKVDMPMALDWRSPKVLMPTEAKEWPDEKLKAIAVHERAHLRTGDVLSALDVNLSFALCWPIPLVWIVSRWFWRDVEMAADDAVLREGVPAERYAELLLEAAVRSG